MPIRAWVFDLDGVLVSSEPLHWAAWREVVGRRGGSLDEEWLPIGIGMTDPEFYRRIAPVLGLTEAMEVILEEKRRVFQAMIDRELPVCPGVEPLLERLQGEYPLAVATSSPRPYLDFVIHQKGWASVFQAAFSRDDVARPKPEPEIYLAAANALGAAPKDCLAIEDSPMGIASACSAGLSVVAVATSFPPYRLRDAHMVLDTLEDQRRLLDFVTAHNDRERDAWEDSDR